MVQAEVAAAAAVAGAGAGGMSDGRKAWIRRKDLKSPSRMNPVLQDLKEGLEAAMTTRGCHIF